MSTYTYTALKGWYRTAGNNYYSWLEDGMDVQGLSLRKDVLTTHGKEINIVIEGKAYTLNTQEAIDFVRKYKSFYRMTGKDGNRFTLGVISRSLFKPAFAK